MNDEEDYEKLIKAIEEIAATAPYEEINSVSIEMPTPQVVMNLAAAYYGKKELVDLESAIGRVSAASIIPYPPGIPLIVPGEMITRELYDHIIMTMENGLEIVGLMGYNKDKIVVVE